MRFVIPLVFVSLSACSSDDGAPSVGPGDIVDTEITVGDLTFSARAAGPEDGELVILLHGFPETSYGWTHQLPALGEAGYRAVAPDQRGYAEGARPADVTDYEIALLVQDAIGMADALGADRFHVVGHDWGAGVAWGLAGTAPERLRSLTIVSIPHPEAFNMELTDMTSCQYQASAYFDFFVSSAAENFFLANDAAGLRGVYEGVGEDAVDEYVRVLGNPTAINAALNWYRANIEDRAFQTGTLGTITTPTLFMWSDMDDAICREPAEATEGYVSAPYRFEVLAGVNHWIPEVGAALVEPLLLEHLADN